MCDRITRTILLLVVTSVALFSEAHPATAASNVIATISIPASSNISVDVNPTTNRIYTSGGGNDPVFIIDGATQSVITTLPAAGLVAVDTTRNQVCSTALRMEKTKRPLMH